MPVPIVLFLSLVGLLAGICAAIQPVINAGLRTSLGSAWWTGSVSYLVGLTAMLVIALASDGVRSPASIAGRFTGMNWTGGLFGAVFVAAGILITPRLGSATTVGLIVVGQLLAAVVLDHFALLGLPRHPVSLVRFAGVGLLIAGAVLVRR